MTLQGFAHAQDLQRAVRAQVQAALAEDVGSGDITAELIAPDMRARATVISRDAGVFCGVPWVVETCAQVDATIDANLAAADGDAISAEQLLFTLEGPARGLLTSERTVLNFVALLSGTATETQRYVRLIQGSTAKLLDTRKTVPGLRMAQKYAVHCGGGHNHRVGLFDAFLIKENHLLAAGGIKQAIEQARATRPGTPVEVEVESLTQLEEALAAGADIALIDNFTLTQTKSAVAMTRGRMKLEASGGINEATITDIAATGVDYISVGAITKRVVPLDLSMRFIDE